MEEIKTVAQQIATMTGDRLTGQKAADICAREGYTVTGVVLTKAAKEGDNFTGVRRCIVNLSAVRWFFDQDKWAEVMYPENRRAELQKDATPVAEVVSEGAFGMEVVSLVSADDYSIKPGTKLYTHPHPKAATVPEGYVLVPKEPTDEMIAAAMGRYKHASDSAAREFVEFHRENFKHDYRAMIEATPSLPAAQSEGEQK